MIRVRRRSAALDLLTDVDTSDWVCTHGHSYFSFEGHIAREASAWQAEDQGSGSTLDVGASSGA